MNNFLVALQKFVHFYKPSSEKLTNAKIIFYWLTKIKIKIVFLC
jgi:hypothetical protein